MNIFKLLLFSFLSLLITSCGSKKNIIDFTLQASTDNATYHLGEALVITPKSLTGKTIESVTYTFQGKTTTVQNNTPLKLSLTSHLLGKHKVLASISSEGETFSIDKEVTILNNKAPKIYNYKIINTYPHNTKHYTQGLEFKGNKLYESTGKKGESKLLLKELETGKTLKEHKIKNAYFAEGLTIVNDKIHQLTWQSNLGFTYDLNTFKQTNTFAYNQSKEGWGLCYDGDKTIYKSDGSTKIWKLNSETLAEEGYVEITTNKSIKSRFNELEWVNGKIYANTWQKDGIAIINPQNGAIEGIINLKGIREKVGVASKDNNRVLNGIAYKKDTNQLFITGKYWNSLFEIEVFE